MHCAGIVTGEIIAANDDQKATNQVMQRRSTRFTGFRCKSTARKTWSRPSAAKRTPPAQSAEYSIKYFPAVLPGNDVGPQPRLAGKLVTMGANEILIRRGNPRATKSGLRGATYEC